MLRCSDQAIHSCILKLNGLTLCLISLLSFKSFGYFLSRQNSWRVQYPACKNVASEFHKQMMFHVAILFLQTVFILFLSTESCFGILGNHSFQGIFQYLNENSKNLGARLFMQQVSWMFKSYEVLLSLKFKF